MTRHIQDSPATLIEEMELTYSTSTFTNFGIFYIRTATGVHKYRFYNSFPAEGTDESLDLLALRTIHRSTTGIRNANGAVVPIRVMGFPHGNTIEDLKAYGYPSPLEGDTVFTDYFDGKKYLGQTAMDGAVEQDSDTGKVSAIARFDIVPKRRKPEGSFNHPLTDWYASGFDYNEWEFIYVFDAGTEHVDDNYVDNPPLAAFAAKMEDLRTVGPVITTELNPVLEATYLNRVYSTTFNGQSTAMAFLLTATTRYTYVKDGTTYISHVRIRAHRDPGNSTVVDVVKINAWLQDTANVYGTLDSSSIPVEPIYIGDSRTPSIANGIVSASGSLRILEPGLEFSRGGARRFTLGPGHGLVVEHTELKQDGSSRYLLPIKTAGVDVVHCTNTSNINLLLEEPSELILWDMNHYTCEIHNTVGSGLVKFLNPSGTEIFALALGESITIRLVRETSGEWEIRFLHVPSRRFEKFTSETASPWADFGGASAGANWYYDGSRYFITPDLDSVQTDYIDGVSFEYAGTFVASAGAHSALANDYTANTIKILTAGNLYIEHYTAYKASGSGSINPGWGAVIQLNDELDQPSRIDKQRLTADGNSSLRMVRQLGVSAGDLITFRTICSATSSLPLANFEIAEKYVRMELTPRLETITS